VVEFIQTVFGAEAAVANPASLLAFLFTRVTAVLAVLVLVRNQVAVVGLVQPTKTVVTGLLVASLLLLGKKEK
jgi:hypothetical protein